MAVGSDFVEEKELLPELFENSVVESPPNNRTPRIGPLILQLATTADSITPWGKDPVKRDRELREFWHTESLLASAVYGVSIRNASFAWHIEGTDKTKPRPKNTINKVTEIIQRSNRGKGWYDLILKTCIDLYCLAGNTKVKLGGDRLGKTKTIARMVKDRDPGPVISVGSDGTLVEQMVTEWHSTPLGNRKWYFLSTKLATNHDQGGKQGGIFLTEDHPMLTDRGWVQAKDLLPTDKIGTSDLVPSEEQAEVLVGGLLGDMSMSRFTKRAIIRFGHSVDQSDYLEFKKSLLKEFGWTGQNSRLTEKGAHSIGVNSLASLGLSPWYDRWYPDGKKRVNREDFVKYFSPRMLAIWFMDDGACQRTLTTANNQSEHAVLCTDGFEKEDVEWLAEELTSRGFSCKVQQIKDKYYRIRFTADGYRALVSYIGEYVIPSMQYKMGQHTKPFNPSVWELEPATIYFDEIEKIEQKDYIGATGKVVETTYHIGVDKTRNFIAGNLVSHNTQDNGAFWEIIRVDNNNPTSPVINFAHLDSGRCWRTGDPEYPVIYRDFYGREHAMPWWRVETLEEFPSPIEEMYGMQYSAVTRALLAAQILRDISIYKKEKVGGNFTRAIDIIGGVSKSNIDDAVLLAEEQNLNRGLYRFSQPVIIPGVDPTHPLSHVHIDLATLPDSFNEDTTFKWYIAQLALAFGVDYQEFAPLMSGNLGSSGQSEILHLKTRGKGPALIMTMLEDKINSHLPYNVRFEFKEQDIRSDRERAEARFIRAKERALLVRSGEIDAIAARQLAVESGDIPEWMIPEIESRLSSQPTEQPSEITFGTDQIVGGIDSHTERKGYQKITAKDIQEARRIVSELVTK